MSETFRTPLARVRGRGAAKAGTGAFIAERWTGVALLVLSIYLAVDAALTLNPSFAGARAWLAQPAIAAPLVLALLITLYHMHIGMQVVIEDYIHKAATKIVLVTLSGFLCLALAAAGGTAILKLSLGS